MNELKKPSLALLRSSPRSIRSKLVLLTIGTFLLFIWTLAYISVTVLQDHFDAVLLEQQFAVTQQVAADLDNKLEERIKFLAQAAQFVPAELHPRALDPFLAQRTSLHVLFSGGLSVIGLDGRIIADYPSGSGRRGLLAKERLYFGHVVATKRPYIDKPVLDAYSKHPALTLAVPVLDAAGRVRAVLTGITDLAAPNFLGIATDRATAGQGQVLVLSRQDRLVVAATDKHRVLTPVPESGLTTIFDQALGGFEGSGFSIGVAGIPTLFSAKQVPTADWVVLAALPTEVARRPVAVMQRYLYGAAAILTLLAIAILWWMTRSVLAQLEETGKTLRRMTKGEIPLAPLPIRSEDEVGHLIGDFNLLIQERQRYETALSDSEQRFRQLVENSPDAIFVQTQGRFAYVNAATLRLFGAEAKDQVEAAPCVDRVHPESRSAVAERIRRINTEGGNSPPMEERYIRIDGSEVVVEVSAVPFHYEGENGALVFVRDISERKRGEQALKSLNRDFVTLLENTSDFIYFKDQQSRFRFCSQPLARITGHSHWREMVGKHDLEVFPPDTARIYWEEELPVFRDGIPLLDKTDPYYDENGVRGWVSTSKWPVFADDGTTVVGLFGISRIVTERIAAQTELKAINKELQAFTYAASHDMKAPLGRINTFSALLEKQYRDRLEGDGLLFLDLVRRNTQRLMILVEDLLAHAEIEQKILSLQAVRLQEAVECIVKEYSDEIQQGGVKVRTDVPELMVRANPHGLAQVLRNLLENALKYSAQEEIPVIEIGARVQGSGCRFWIRDNGIGFDMAYHDRIFEVFRRLHTYEEYPGSGVGLALVKKAMERMGGRVWAESNTGQGATFYLELELATSTAKTAAERQQAVV